MFYSCWPCYYWFSYHIFETVSGSRSLRLSWLPFLSRGIVLVTMVLICFKCQVFNTIVPQVAIDQLFTTYRNEFTYLQSLIRQQQQKVDRNHPTTPLNSFPVCVCVYIKTGCFHSAVCHMLVMMLSHLYAMCCTTPPLARCASACMQRRVQHWKHARTCKCAQAYIRECSSKIPYKIFMPEFVISDCTKIQNIHNSCL